jgi:hypothetical protein
MGFRANNFTVTTLLLIAFTVFMATVRNKKPLDNNWPLLYWMLVVAFTLVRQEDTFNVYIVMVGLLSGLLLRFEFLNEFFVKLVRIVEIAVQIYVVIRGFQIILT